jgi:hypothetical protein
MEGEGVTVAGFEPSALVLDFSKEPPDPKGEGADFEPSALVLGFSKEPLDPKEKVGSGLGAPNTLGVLLVLPGWPEALGGATEYCASISPKVLNTLGRVGCVIFDSSKVPLGFPATDVGREVLNEKAG